MALALEHVEFAYTPARPVVRGVSLALRAGAVTAIVGPNGAGKSTLLRLMAGVLKPGAGRVTLDGASVAGMPHRARARRIGYLAQRPALAFSYTLEEYVRLGLYAAGAGNGGAPVARALERVDLATRARDPFGALSAGQQQRAALARVLAQLNGALDATVVLADEPVSAMDPRHALEAMAMFRESAHAGGAVAVVLHDLDLAARCCDEAVLLAADGKVAAAGPIGATLTPSLLDPVFAVRFQVAPALVASAG